MASVTDIGNGGRAPEGFRTKPHNLEIEQLLIGVLLVRNDALSQVRDRLRDEHFYDPNNRAIYAKIAKRIGNGKLANVEIISSGMDAQGKEAMWRMASVASSMMTEEITQCTDELISLWQRRQAIDVAKVLENASYDTDVSADEWRQKAIEALEQVEIAGPAKPPAIPPPHIDLSRLAGPLPQRRFIVDQWLPIGHVSSIYGEGSAGKSFLSMILGSCVAAGIPWLGAHINVQCNVLGFFCEDNDDEILIREHQILKGLSLRWQDVVPHLFLCGRVGYANTMMTFEHGAPVEGPAMKDLMAKIEEIGPKLIILDNIGHFYGGNENDRFQVTSFLNRLAGIARQIDGVVVILGHPPKSEEKYSGSTAWSNNVRSRLWLERCADDEDRWILQRAKSNYAEPCTLELIRDSATGIVRPDLLEYESEASRHERDRKLGGARTHILQTLDVLNAREQFTSERRQAPNYLPKVMAEEKMASEFKPKVLERALDSLMHDGMVIRDVVGTYGKGAKRMGLIRAATVV